MDSIHEMLEAVRAGDMERIRTLLNSDNRLAEARTAAGASPLMTALYYGRKEIVALLLSRRPEMDFYEAVALGDENLVQDMITDHPDLPHSQSWDGFTGLHLAVFFGHESIARLLIRRGADVNAISANRTVARNARPIHSAVSANRPGMVRLLLDNGAKVNARQDGGFTPLHGAAAGDSAVLIELLLSSGADPSLLAEDGSSPASIAEQRGHAEIVRLLREAKNPPPGGVR